MRDQMAKGKNGRVERAGWSGQWVMGDGRWATAVAPPLIVVHRPMAGSEHSGGIIILEGQTWELGMVPLDE